MSDFMSSFLPFWGKIVFFCIAWTLWFRRVTSPQISPRNPLASISLSPLRHGPRKGSRLPYSVFTEAWGLLSVQVKRFSSGEVCRVPPSTRRSWREGKRSHFLLGQRAPRQVGDDLGDAPPQVTPAVLTSASPAHEDKALSLH